MKSIVKEFKLSQYANYTSPMLDGSTTFMHGILQDLHYFANISRLRIFFQKTVILGGK